MKKVPHCGGIFYSEDEEKVERLFRHLLNTTKKRKQMLAEAGVLTADEYRNLKKGIMPLIIVAIDNYAGFYEAYENYTDTLQKLLREGIACGIHFIVSINAASDMRNKISQNFSTSIPLILNERSDYYSYLGTTPQIPPMGTPGSGLFNYRNSIVQFQTAFISDPVSIKNKVRYSLGDYTATPIRYIDKTQIYAEYLSELDNSILSNNQCIPLGWYTRDIAPYCVSLKKDFCYFISDVVGNGYTSALRNIISFAEANEIELHYVCSNDRIVEYAPSAHIYHEHNEIYQLMSYLRSKFKERSDALKEYKAQGGTDSAHFIENNYSNILVVFEDYNTFIP